jgi:hypothetical protein
VDRNGGTLEIMTLTTFSRLTNILQKWPILFLSCTNPFWIRVNDLHLASAREFKIRNGVLKYLLKKLGINIAVNFPFRKERF